MYGIHLSAFLMVSLVGAFSIDRDTDTRCSYEKYFGTNRPLQDEDWILPPGEHPVSFAVVARHGSRMPSNRFIDGFERLRREISENMHLVRDDRYRRILSIDLTRAYPRSDAETLTRVGVDEHVRIGENLRRFVDRSRRPNVSSTDTDRTVRSAQSFCYGLYSRSEPRFDPLYIRVANISDDPVLHFFSICPRYDREVRDAPPPPIYEEFADLRFDGISRSIARRMSSAWVPSRDALVSMWDACVSGGAGSPYCDLFDEDQAVLMSYAADLSEYAMKSYGAPAIAIDMSCPLLSSLVEGIAGRRNALYFTHAEALFPLQVVLGLYEERLRSDWSIDRIRGRVWDTSRMLNYASTIGFFEYVKSDGGSCVVTTAQGRPVTPDGCPSLCCDTPTLLGILSSRLPCRFSSLCA